MRKSKPTRIETRQSNTVQHDSQPTEAGTAYVDLQTREDIEHVEHNYSSLKIQTGMTRNTQEEPRENIRQEKEPYLFQNICEAYENTQIGPDIDVAKTTSDVTDYANLRF